MRVALGVAALLGIALALDLGVEAATPAPRPPDAMCAQELKAVQLLPSSSTCWVDERVTASNGVLTWPCTGGRASAVFGGATFHGEVSAEGKVGLPLEPRFDFKDGCKWRSTQTISGVLKSDRLSYDYREEPLEGQSGCMAACTAKGEVRIRPPPEQPVM